MNDFITRLFAEMAELISVISTKLNWLYANKADTTALNDFVKKDGSVPMTGRFDLADNQGAFFTNNWIFKHDTILGGFNLVRLTVLDGVIFAKDSNNFVGIHTTDPQAELHINGNAIVDDATANNHAVNLGQVNGFLANKLEANDLDGFVYDVTYNSANHQITFYQQNEPNIVIDLPIEQLIKGVQLVGDDLVFTFEDGSTVTVPLNTLLVGVVKSVNGLTPNSQGEIILNITDIPGLSSALAAKANVNGNNLTNIADWRTNLGVYSTTQVDGFLANKANTTGTYLGFISGDSKQWNGQNYTNVELQAEPYYFLGYDAVNNTWKPITSQYASIGLSNYLAQIDGGNLTNIANWQNVLGVGSWNQYDGSTTAQTPTFVLMYDSSVNLWRPAGANTLGNFLSLGSYAQLSQVYTQAQVNTLLNDKVDKVAGKQLSTEDYTSAEKTKLAGIAAGAEVNVNADWNATSGDAQILNKPTIPSAPNNGTITYTGVGSITGGGTSSADQSNDTDYEFDLTQQTKDEIQVGIDAGSKIESLFGGLSTYFKDTDVSGGGNFPTNEAFFNLFDPGSASVTVGVGDHSIDGARLVLQSHGTNTVNYTGNFIYQNSAVGTVPLENGRKVEFVWSAAVGKYKEVLTT